jgi:hypothetical protein
MKAADVEGKWAASSWGKKISKVRAAQVVNPGVHR